MFKDKENIPRAIGPYSQFIKSQNMLYISGQIPVNPSTGIINTNISEATKQILDNITSILEYNSLTIQDVIKCQIYLKDMDTFDEMNAVYAQYFKDNKPLPVRECVEVSRLPKDSIIEISCIAEYKM